MKQITLEIDAGDEHCGGCKLSDYVSDCCFKTKCPFIATATKGDIENFKYHDKRFSSCLAASKPMVAVEEAESINGSHIAPILKLKELLPKEKG